MATTDEKLRSWLSRGVEELVAEMAAQDRNNRRPEFDCDVLIVGSGYGGAVAAARLAGSRVAAEDRPARIWLLERGAEYRVGTFPSRFSELPGHVRLGHQDGKAPRGRDEGLFDFRLGPDVSVLVGNGLGGTSLINAGVMEEPDNTVWASDWPAGVDADALRTGYNAARVMLGVQQVSVDRETAKLHALDALLPGSEKARRCAVAVNFGPDAVTSSAGVALQACTRCGDCVTGCNQGAKGTLDTNYLAFAAAREAMLYCGGSVQYLQRHGKGWSVFWNYTERALRLSEGAPMFIRARQVVLAAGALGSTEILLRSRDKGLALSKECLGRKFSANGDYLIAGLGHRTAVHAVADEASDAGSDGDRRVGPTITGVVDVPGQGKQPAFKVEEFAVPAALRHLLGEAVSTLAAVDSFGMPGSVNAGKEDRYVVDDDTTEHISVFGLMGDDGAQGVMRLAASDDAARLEGGVCIDWEGVSTLPLFESMCEWMEPRLKLGRAIAVPGTKRPITKKMDLPVMTVHPLGGCPMGDGPHAGVVDSHGRVFDPLGPQPLHDGLAVLDGAIVPRALGINPALTITALAERAMPVLMKCWGLEPCNTDLRPLPHRPRVVRIAMPPSSTEWQLRECLSGEWPRTDGQPPLWARLQISFEKTAGWRALLAQQPPRKVRSQSATLELRDGRGRQFEVVQRVQLCGKVTLFEPVAPDALADARVRLDYAFTVAAHPAEPADGARLLQPGDLIRGSKILSVDPEVTSSPPSLWRQLSELEIQHVSAAGQSRDIGRWTLDLDDLAVQRQAVLHITQQSNMPDALADLAAVILYLLRRNMFPFAKALLNFSTRPTAHGLLAQRWPSKVGDLDPTIVDLRTGGRLSRYRSSVADEALPPIVLLHGMGMSGTSFTDVGIGIGLVAYLLRERSEVWVLDVCSSIANEEGRRSAASEQWTAQQIGQDEVPAAIERVLTETQADKVDIFAHCMGAVMFCFAALSTPSVGKAVHRVVLSQVGPLVTLSPLNRFRGFLAAYLRQYFAASEFDTHPDFSFDHASATWTRSTESSGCHTLVDALLALLFPYPDQSEEEVQAASMADKVQWRRVRHRADAMVGQLFELENVSDASLDRLDALLGWVKVPMLAQAIHFGRFEMLMDARGSNSLLSSTTLQENFGFPLLIVHGQLNRVFEWDGSWRSMEMLKQLRNETARQPGVRVERDGCAGYDHYGAGSSTQLAVFQGYGHLDCIIGKQSHRDVFPVLSAFYKETAAPTCEATPTPPEPEPPWIGPMLGSLRSVLEDAEGRRVDANVLLHASPRRAGKSRLVAVPMRLDQSGTEVPDLDAAVETEWGGSPAVLKLRIQLDNPDAGLRLALFTLHGGLSLEPLHWSPLVLPRFSENTTVLFGHVRTRELAVPASVWIEGWRIVPKEDRQHLKTLLAQDSRLGLTLADSTVRLTAHVLAAADYGKVDAQVTPEVHFALASCQYPAGVLDAEPASASYRRLARDKEPQFLVLTGDQVYLDATAGVFDPVFAPTSSALDRKAELDLMYEQTWRMPEFRQVTARLPMLALLDDHEVRNDWQGTRSDPLNRTENLHRLNAFERHQDALNSPKATRRVLGHPDSFSFMSFPGGVPFCMLDTRARRSPRDHDPLSRRRILTDDVMAALCQQLRDLPAASVKFVVSPVPLLPPERFGTAERASRIRSDTWSAFPECTAELLLHIRDNNIQHVVLLSGDSHMSSVSEFQLDQDKPDLPANKLVSIVSSGLYIPWPFVNQCEDEVVLDGPAVFAHKDGRVCAGTMCKLGVMREQGYAVVGLRARAAGPQLVVRLQPASMAQIAPEILIDWPFNPGDPTLSP